MLVFDGDCAFCTSAADWLGDRLARDPATDAELIPWQLTDLAAIGTSAERARSEVLWLATDDGLYGGADAVAHWLRHARGAWGLLGRLIALPLVRTLASAGYRLIARSRHRLPGGSPACALPPPAARADN